MFQLREYQRRAKNQLYKAIKEGNKKILWCLPTGAGKSSICASVVKQCVAKGKRVVFAVHSEELVKQFHLRLREQFNIDSGIIMASYKQRRELLVQVCSIQTLVRREYPKTDIVFIDECHRAKSNSYKKMIDNYSDKIIVGLTATPFRGDGKGLDDIFDTIVHPVKIQELISLKHLVSTKVYAPEYEVNMKGVKTVGGDFSKGEMYDKFQDKGIAKGVIHNYVENACGMKTIVFCINVRHSKETAQMFIDNGFKAKSLDGTTDKEERRRVVKEFAEGKIDILTNCALFIEGFDIPDTECVVLNRATKSLNAYVQMVGRGLRPAGNKKECIVLDHGGNTIRHGFVEDYDCEDFDLKGVKKRKVSKPTKKCPSCFVINHASSRTCTCCGTEFKLKEKEPTKFIEVESFGLLDRQTILVKRLNNTTLKEGKKLPLSQIRLFGVIKNYSRNWWFPALKFQRRKELQHIDFDQKDAFVEVKKILEDEEFKTGNTYLYEELKNKVTKPIAQTA